MSWKTSPTGTNVRVNLHRHGETSFPIERSRADDVLGRMGLVADSHPARDDRDHLLDLSLNRTDPDARPGGDRSREDRWPTSRII